MVSIILQLAPVADKFILRYRIVKYSIVRTNAVYIFRTIAIEDCRYEEAPSLAVREEGVNLYRSA